MEYVDCTGSTSHFRLPVTWVQGYSGTWHYISIQSAASTLVTGAHGDGTLGKDLWKSWSCVLRVGMYWSNADPELLMRISGEEVERWDISVVWGGFHYHPSHWSWRVGFSTKEMWWGSEWIIKWTISLAQTLTIRPSRPNIPRNPPMRSLDFSSQCSNLSSTLCRSLLIFWRICTSFSWEERERERGREGKGGGAKEKRERKRGGGKDQEGGREIANRVNTRSRVSRTIEG